MHANLRQLPGRHGNSCSSDQSKWKAGEAVPLSLVSQLVTFKTHTKARCRIRQNIVFFCRGDALSSEAMSRR